MVSLYDIMGTARFMDADILSVLEMIPVPTSKSTTPVDADCIR